MPQAQGHNKPEAAYNTPLGQEHNTQPEEKYKPPAGLRTLEVSDTMVVVDMFPGDKPAAAWCFLPQKPHRHWIKILCLETILSFSWFTSLLKVSVRYFALLYRKSYASQLFSTNSAN
jgi:hypothetical protein